MRTSVRITLALGLALAVAVAGAVVLQAGKPASNELSAVFQESAGEMVRSDGIGPYVSPNPQHVGGGVFFDPRLGNLLFSGWVGDYTRLVTFDFGSTSNVRNAVVDGTVECRDYFGNPLPREALPHWLPGIPEATWFLIRSEAIVDYRDGVWTSQGGWGNVRDMAVPSTVIVGLNMTFKTADGREFWLFFNEEHWGGKDLKSVPGFVKITRETVDRWVLEPLGADDPRPIGVANQAGLYAYVPPVRKVHGGGGCDYGAWLMPFKITLTRVP